MLTPYILYAKLGALALLLVILAFAGYKVNSWHEGYLAKDAIEAQAKADRQHDLATIEQLKSQYAASQKASEGFQREIADINSRPVPTGPVRLCVNRPVVPKPSTVASGPSQALPAAQLLPEQAGSDTEQGPDIGPDLRKLAREADEVSAQGRAIQSLKSETSN